MVDLNADMHCFVVVLSLKEEVIIKANRVVGNNVSDNDKIIAFNGMLQDIIRTSGPYFTALIIFAVKYKKPQCEVDIGIKIEWGQCCVESDKAPVIVYANKIANIIEHLECNRLHDMQVLSRIHDDYNAETARIIMESFGPLDFFNEEDP